MVVQPSSAVTRLEEAGDPQEKGERAHMDSQLNSDIRKLWALQVLLGSQGPGWF